MSLYKYIGSPQNRSLFAGVLLAGAALAILFGTTDRYRVSEISSAVASDKVQQIYDDLDNDDLSEKIEFHEYSENISAILVYSKGRVTGQWTFRGSHGAAAMHITGDINDDGIKEVILFTRNGDSLFLNCVDAVNNIVRFSDIPVCRLYPIADKCSYVIRPVTLKDMNRDGINEFLFTINTGYETRPRGIFAFYPVEKKIISSPESCSLLDVTAVFDTDGDGFPEILCNSRATGNCDESRAYTDLYGWLMVFSPELSYRFPPVRLDPYPAEISVLPFRQSGGYKTLVLHDYRGSDTINDFLSFHEHDGRLAGRNDLRVKGGDPPVYPVILPVDDLFTRCLLIDHAGSVYEINDDLTLSLYRKIPATSHLFPPKIFDIEGDGENEFLFVSSDGRRLIIFRNDFSNPVHTGLNGNFPWLFISSFKDGSGIPKFSVDTGISFTTYMYSTSLVYRFWYLAVLMVMAASYTVTTIAARLSELRRIKLEKSRYQLAELQLKSVSNQIDPHFTFNLLETFGSLIDEHDTSRAEFIFNNYSGLLKATVLNSDKLRVTLKEELDFVTSYIELERFRYGGKFGYHLKTDESVDTSLMLPKMIVHIFAENAIKHGLRHLENRKGLLNIKVSGTGGMTCIIVADNGIGRKKARELNSFSTGRGNTIVQEMTALCRILYGSEIDFTIKDLNGESSGTEVTITIKNR